MHSKAEHPNLDSEPALITATDMIKEQDLIVSESTKFVELVLTPQNIKPLKTPPMSPRLAKKSTTKQSVDIFKINNKATARKSTNYCYSYKEDFEFPSQAYSWYGKNASPVDLSAYNCNIVFSNMNMKVNCAKLAKFCGINIEPTLKLKDIMK